jgi:hypothetical protein
MSQSICCLASRGFKGAVISALRTVTSLGLHKFMFTNLLKVGCVPQVFSYITYRRLLKLVGRLAPPCLGPRNVPKNSGACTSLSDRRWPRDILCTVSQRMLRGDGYCERFTDIPLRSKQFPCCYKRPVTQLSFISCAIQDILWCTFLHTDNFTLKHCRNRPTCYLGG